MSGDDRSEGTFRLAVPQSEDEAKNLYHTRLPQIITTFNMPHHTANLERISVDYRELFNRLPFGDFAIREPFTVNHKDADVTVSGIEHLVVSLGDDNGTPTLTLVSHMRFNYPGGNYGSTYVPNDPTTPINVQLASASLVLRLYEALYQRTHRFIEEPVSRPVRKSQGLPKAYREYIVIPRTDARYAGAIRGGEISKRLRTLHAVRGHPRTYRTGETIWIKPHLRGSGDLLQQRDYKIRP